MVVTQLCKLRELRGTLGLCFIYDIYGACELNLVVNTASQILRACCIFY